MELDHPPHERDQQAQPERQAKVSIMDLFHTLKLYEGRLIFWKNIA